MHTYIHTYKANPFSLFQLTDFLYMLIFQVSVPDESTKWGIQPSMSAAAGARQRSKQMMMGF
jgi:hypothetical protein